MMRMPLHTDKKVYTLYTNSGNHISDKKQKYIIIQLTWIILCRRWLHFNPKYKQNNISKTALTRTRVWRSECTLHRRGAVIQRRSSNKVGLLCKMKYKLLSLALRTMHLITRYIKSFSFIHKTYQSSSSHDIFYF